MTEPIEIDDTYGDVGNVSASLDRVYITVITDPGDSKHEVISELSYTPAQARKFRKALKRAIQSAERH